MKYLSLVLLFLTSCTFSINAVSTAGRSKDTVDSAQEAKSSVDPTLSIPESVVTPILNP